MENLRAPADPEKKRKSFCIVRKKEITGSVQPDGTGIQFLYLDDGRLAGSAGIAGNITDPEILKMLETAEGFRALVHSIGVCVEAQDPEEVITFAFQMYGKTDRYESGTTLRMPVRADGMEYILRLDDTDWSEDDEIPGQIRFEFRKAGELAQATVRLYLKDGFDAPEEEEESGVDFDSDAYRKMIARSLMQTGNPSALKCAIRKARNGEDITIAFIGGSITQGAGAVPIHTQCYARKAFEGLCGLAGKGMGENIHYVKAGVGGTSSELGMIRYERDVLRGGSVTPDIVVVEFAVNDEGDETKGECYDSLVRKILRGENHPAVILLFSVFADDWNLQERLSVVGKAYDLPMVSIRDAVTDQFHLTGSRRVVSKFQFFYDSYHPTNIGHRIMADSLIELMRKVDEEGAEEDGVPAFSEEIKPPLGGEFQNVKLLDRRQNECGARIDCGDFVHTDEDLQAVERDMNLVPTPEFPYNWFYQGDRESPAPFVMDIRCTALLLVYKDSGSARFGRAEVFVDGKKALLADPSVIGWTHCNAVICMRGAEQTEHHVEIHMKDNDKCFTILGFGYVE